MKSSRRGALKQIGFGFGAVATGCMPVPERCGPSPAFTGAGAARALLDDVEAVVVLTMENRSFDHHLGALRQDRTYPSASVVDGLRGHEVNPDEAGRMVQVHRLPYASRYNPAHMWTPSREAWGGGRNDGFVRVNRGLHQEEVMGFHDRERLPVQYALADEFVVCDRWFASVMGPTWPNRFYLQAATSNGVRENAPIGLDAPATVWERMAERCLPTRNYFAGPAPFYAAGFPAKAFSGNDAVTAARIEEFFRDARAGNLPPFSVVDPDFLAADGHPRHDLTLSEVFLGAVYRALADSPQWKRSLLVVNYDEHGGFFDHVPPPVTADPRPDFRQLGFRVPALVVGPTTWRGRSVSAPLEHVSVAATLRARFGIESLGARMDAAGDLSPCIDPDRVGRPRPAPVLPTVELRRAQVLEATHRPTSQPELFAAVAEHRVPERFVDPRAPLDRLTGWLRHAQELEAVRIR